jgi:hypothetical protein
VLQTGVEREVGDLTMHAMATALGHDPGGLSRGVRRLAEERSGIRISGRPCSGSVRPCGRGGDGNDQYVMPDSTLTPHSRTGVPEQASDVR